MSVLQSLDVISSFIRSRRSIKPVDMDPARDIDRELLLALFENANHAPTHGLTEPWRFVVFQGEGRRDLSEMMQKTYRETTPAEVAPHAGARIETPLWGLLSRSHGVASLTEARIKEPEVAEESRSFHGFLKP